ncbi:Integrator complex subunit 11 [Geodia barretti]|uniref:Integrator complex subunit 11 n=1 Tax=Geodia barretti TaxID=519541 RepID=A0AA35XF63_GEOBA|nr:Integrator complex subunit 11 [Geodia barretti]
MAEIRAVPLGAGQDVGRSCILVSMGGKNIMLDCGMHMGFNDERRFPDFSYITDSGRSLTEHLDCVIISHFHLDHCGALPYFSEMCGYDGPIFMTHPTKAICPILLEDYRKITVDRKGEQNFFTSQMIKDCMKKVVTVNLHQAVKVDPDLEIKAYYAGHVLGAAMFQVKVHHQSIVYTIGVCYSRSAWIDKCRPDLLITESTYATTIRDSKRCRERDFLKKISECMERDGKVSKQHTSHPCPVDSLTASGPDPSVCSGKSSGAVYLTRDILASSPHSPHSHSYTLHTRERMNLLHPIYFSAGLTEKANHYYKLFISWTNQNIKNTFVQRNMFEFKHIKPFDRSYIDNPGPMVVFATPGMLHAGLSLQIFKKWAEDEKNMLIMPGYCVAGTVGHKILSGHKKIEIDKKMVTVRLSVQYMSFSAHADAKGIMQLIRQADPANVMLVHGEAAKMDFLRQKIMQEFGVHCYMPANGEMVSIATKPMISVDVSRSLLKRTQEQIHSPLAKKLCPVRGSATMSGLLVMRNEVRSLNTPEN